MAGDAARVAKAAAFWKYGFESGWGCRPWCWAPCVRLSVCIMTGLPPELELVLFVVWVTTVPSVIPSTCPPRKVPSWICGLDCLEPNCKPNSQYIPVGDAYGGRSWPGVLRDAVVRTKQYLLTISS
jgi:hypothetical protein